MSTSPVYLESAATTSARLPRVSPLAWTAIGGMLAIAASYLYIILEFDAPKVLLTAVAVLTGLSALMLTGKRWAAIPGLLLVVANFAIELPLLTGWHMHDLETARATIANLIVMPVATSVVVWSAIAYTVQSYRGACLELGKIGQAGIVVALGAVAGGSIIALMPQYGATARVSQAAVDSLEPSVVMADSLFQEEAMTVAVGEPVQWRVLNADNIGHTFDIDGLGIHMTIEGGESGFLMFVADKAGEYTFRCKIPGHDKMKGTLVVQ